MTRDFEKVGSMPFAADARPPNKDPIEAALSSIEDLLSALRAASETPPLPPADLKPDVICASVFAAILVGACWLLV
jgi:hypothetical protein